jgi:hypothetical protein
MRYRGQVEVNEDASFHCVQTLNHLRDPELGGAHDFVSPLMFIIGGNPASTRHRLAIAVVLEDSQERDPVPVACHR